jgi:hypothetical protein
MSGFDGVLIFGGVGLIIILPIAAIAGVYYLSRQNKHKFQCLIEMDGARCVQAMNGSVAINPRIWLNFFVLIFFVVTLGACGLLAADNLSRSLSMPIGQVALVAFSALSIVSAVIYLWRALRRPTFYFNPERQTLDIRRGRSIRQIPFAQMAKLSVEVWQKDVSLFQQGFYGRQSLPCAGIKLGLANGEAIELGTLSSLMGDADLWKRCGNICHLVADVSGASLPSELQSDPP